jgi:predicted aminopeptidase
MQQWPSRPFESIFDGGTGHHRQGATINLKPSWRSIYKPAFRLSAALFLTGVCCGCYVLKQGAYLLNHQMHAKRIDRLLADSALAGGERAFLNEVNRIRAFAADSMGLVRNCNYTRLVHIDSSYLLAMLSAADSASFTVKRWRYPCLGSFPLRSYFDVRDAKRAGAKLAREGYEICIEKSDGYSTLGIVSDPVYSFMANYPVYYLADYIFHEQTHATVYLRNVEFSEELATFMAREGALRYLRAFYGPASRQYIDACNLIKDNETWQKQIHGLIIELDSIYHLKITRSEKISRKQMAVKRFKARLEASYDSIFITPHFRGLEKQSFNNAYLSIHMTYYNDLDLFARLFESYGHDFRRLTAFAVSLKKRKEDPKVLLKRELGIN